MQILHIFLESPVHGSWWLEFKALVTVWGLKMSFNVKHYVAVGLGIGIATAYCWHTLNHRNSAPIEGTRLQSVTELSSDQYLSDIVAPMDTTTLNTAQPSVVPQADVATSEPIDWDNSFVAPTGSVDNGDELELSPAMFESADDTSVAETQASPESDFEPAPQFEFTAQNEMAGDTSAGDFNAPAEMIAQEPATDYASNSQDFPVAAEPQTIPLPSLVEDSTGQAASKPVTPGFTSNPFFQKSSTQVDSPQVAGATTNLPVQLRNDFFDPNSARSSQDSMAKTTAPQKAVKQQEKHSVLNTAKLNTAKSNTVESPKNNDNDFAIPEFHDFSGKLAQTEAPAFTQLPTSQMAPTRVALPDAVAFEAVNHIEYGKSLTRRGASFAARQEFFAALRLIAQSNDSAVGTNEFSKSLSDAILAMKEAEDFIIFDAEAEGTLDVAAVVNDHRSKILDQNDASRMTAQNALQVYFEYAARKFGYAGGRNVVVAEALYCLGKLHTAVVKDQRLLSVRDRATAATFYRASLTNDANHFRSANELGVLVARAGDLGEATDLFKQSLLVRQSPHAWRNLSIVHKRLGEFELAQLAEKESFITAQTQQSGSQSVIRWIDASELKASSPIPAQTRVAAEAQPAKQQQPAKENTLGKRLKKLF